MSRPTHSEIRIPVYYESSGVLVRLDDSILDRTDKIQYHVPKAALNAQL